MMCIINSTHKENIKIDQIMNEIKELSKEGN